ncbi:hypothetical protein BH10PSE17_BH10PSE17_32950 [soil metagenome]
MRTSILIALSSLALLSAGPAMAQYKYKDANGRTVYSDQPPPAEARDITKRDFAPEAATTVDSSRMPYELRRAVEAAPVTLYTTTDCQPCEMGRQFLNKRGIPFVEKTAVPTPENRNALAALGLGTTFPSIAIGNNRLTNYAPTSWNAALDAASYPTSPPPSGSYVNPPPSPLAQPAAPGVATQPAPAVTSPTANPAATPDNPAGIRF